MAPLCCRFSLVTVVVASVGVLIITQTQAELQCYQCHSAEQPDCRFLNENHTALLKPCKTQDPRLKGQQPFCRKIHQTIHRRDGLKVVVRRCGWVRHEAGDCYRVRNMDHAETVCQCFSDGCNSAHQPRDGIRCYVCNSKQDPRCLDPFSSNLTALDTVDCERDNSVRAALETVANLMTRLGQAPARDSADLLSQASQTPPAAPASCQKIDLRVLGERVTGRGCSVLQMENFNPCDAVKLVTTPDVTLEFCGVCDSDACNDATAHTVAASVLLVTLMFSCRGLD